MLTQHEKMRKYGDGISMRKYVRSWGWEIIKY
jgi:hypothetical protein